jgi:hypothetical protein
MYECGKSSYTNSLDVTRGELGRLCKLDGGIWLEGASRQGQGACTHLVIRAHLARQLPHGKVRVIVLQALSRQPPKCPRFKPFADGLLNCWIRGVTSRKRM